MHATKIVATVGPNVLHDQGIRKLIETGVSVFRFNFKHNDVEWHNDGIRLVNQVSEEMGVPVSTMIDLQGPSIRVNMPQDEIILHNDEKIYFGQIVFDNADGAGKDGEGKKGISLTHPGIIDSLKEGQEIMADDGKFRFTLKRESGQAYLLCHTNGVLLNKKNLNIPGSDFPFPILVERDLEGLALGAKVEVDYVALSFVRSRQDVLDLKKEMDVCGLKAHIVSKIETRIGLDNISEIIDESDAIMVARGDLGVEVPYEEVPYYQKKIIRECLVAAKPVITATQMLNSMIEDPTPTRAEVSDIANAVFDLSDAIMLSGETAFGPFPYEAVQTMARVASFNEGHLLYDIRKRYDLKIADNEARICDMAYNLFLSLSEDQKLDFGGFLIFTESGRTARLMARYRPRPAVNIYAMTKHKDVRDRLAMSYAVRPFVYQPSNHEGQVMHEDMISSLEELKKQGKVTSGQGMIVLHGDVWSEVGGTSTVKFAIVP